MPEAPSGSSPTIISDIPHPNQVSTNHSGNHSSPTRDALKMRESTAERRKSDDVRPSPQPGRSQSPRHQNWNLNQTSGFFGQQRNTRHFNQAQTSHFPASGANAWAPSQNMMPHAQSMGYYPVGCPFPYAPAPYHLPQYGHATPGYGWSVPQYIPRHLQSSAAFPAGHYTPAVGSMYAQHDHHAAHPPQISQGWQPPRTSIEPYALQPALPLSASQFGAASGTRQDHSMRLPLYGPRLGDINVVGDALSIAELQKAVNVSRLMVQKSSPETNAHAFRVSARYHEQIGSLPEIDGNENFTLHRLSTDELRRLDIREEDLQMSALIAFQYSGDPPFKDVIIEKALLLLEALGKYHENDGAGGPRIWQVCVTTNNSGSHRVQLFKRKPLDVVTNTLHLYREIIGSGHHYRESWKGFVLSPDAPPPIPERSTSSPSVASEEPRQAVSGDHDYGYESDNDLTADALLARNRSSRATATRSDSFIRIISPGQLITRKLNGFEGISCPDRDTRARVPAHLTDEQLLTGMIHPEDICGTLLLDLAKRNSNKKIAAHVLALYNALPGTRNKTMNANCITKRITLALQSQAAKQGKDFETLREAYYAERRANGAQAKEEARRGATPAVKRATAARKRKAQSERAGFIRRRSSSLSSTAFESDLEDELRDLHEIERPSKRSRKSTSSMVKRELNVDSDEEEKKPVIKKPRRTADVDAAVEAPRTLRSRKPVVKKEEDHNIKQESDNEDDSGHATGSKMSSGSSVGVKEEDDSDGSEFQASEDDDE